MAASRRPDPASTGETQTPPVLFLLPSSAPRVLPAVSATPGVPSTMEPSSSSSAVASQTWELENNISAAATDPDAQDEIYCYDEKANAQAHQARPGASDRHHFRRAKISTLALLKMVVHARSSSNIEIMDLMQGKVEGNSMIVMDAFALPVEDSETSVNAAADACEYMVEYSTINKKVTTGGGGLGQRLSRSCCRRPRRSRGHRHPVARPWMTRTSSSPRMTDITIKYGDGVTSLLVSLLGRMISGTTSLGLIYTWSG